MTMAKTAKTTTKSSKSSKSNPLYSIYGARESKSGERINISILTGRDDNIKWGTISLPKDGGRNVKIKKITDIDVTIVIPRVDIDSEETEEEEDDED